MFTKEMQLQNSGNKWFSGAVIAISVVILQDLLVSKITDISIFISSMALVIEIPLLAACLTINFHESLYSRRAKKTHTYLHNGMYGLGLLSGFIGICSALWHLSWIIGTVFLVCSLLTFSISTSHHNEISKADKVEEDYNKEIADKNIGFNLLLQEQELRISIDPMGKTTTHELAYILRGFSQSLQEMDNISIDELEKITKQKTPE